MNRTYRYFRSDRGEWIVLAGQIMDWDSGVLFSKDGVTCHELLLTNAELTPTHADKLTTYDPHNNIVRVITSYLHAAKKIEVDGKVFRLVKQADKIDQIVGLPSKFTLPLSGLRAEMFTGTRGWTVAFFPPRNDLMLISKDGVTFHPISTNSYAGGPETEHFTFTSALNRREKHMWRLGSVVFLGGEEIAHERNTEEGSPDLGKPYIHAFGGDFVLNEAVRRKNRLTRQEVANNKPGTIYRIPVAGARLIVGANVLTETECPEQISITSIVSDLVSSSED